MPDPGDTAAGDKGTGSQSSPNAGTKSGGTGSVASSKGPGGSQAASKASSSPSGGSNMGGQKSSSQNVGSKVTGDKVGTSNAGGNIGGQKSSTGNNTKMSNSTQSGISGNKSSTTGSTMGAAKSSTTGPGASQAAAKASATKTPTASPKGPAASQAASKASSQNLVSPTSALKTTTSDPYANSRRGPTGPSGEASQTTTNLRTPLGGPQATPSAEVKQQRYSDLIKPDIGLRGPLGPDGSFTNENQFANRAQMQDFQLTDVANRLTAAGTPVTPEQARQIARTLAGEAIGETDEQQSAVIQTMANRLRLGTDVNDMLAAYDANGMRRGTTPNSVYNNATPGSDAVGAGIAAIANQINPESPYNLHAPDAVKNATHYLTKDLEQTLDTSRPGHWSNSPSFEDTKTTWGNHVFGNAEPTAQQVASLRTGTQIAGADPTRLSSIPDPAGSVYDTAGLSRPGAVDPTRVASLEDTFAPNVGPGKLQDRLPATEPSYFNDIADRYIAPPTPAAAPPPRDDRAPTQTTVWDKEIEAAMGQPYARFTAPIAPAAGQPYAAFKAPPAEDIFSGANSIYALPDTIPGFADQGVRKSIPGSYPALAAPANLPAQGQPYAAFEAPSAPVAVDPHIVANLANALGVDVPTAKQIVDRISITGPENLVATTANWGPESTALMTTGLVDPNLYRDPWAQQNPQFQERVTAIEPEAQAPFRNGANPNLPPGYADRYFNGGTVPASDGAIPQDDPDEVAAEAQAAEQPPAIVGYTPDGVPIYSGPTTNRNKPAPYPVKGGKIQKGVVAGGLAAGSILTGLPLNTFQKPANYLVNKMRNEPYSGEPGAALPRMESNAANRSSGDNQAAQQEAARRMQLYYDMLYSSLIPDDGTLGNGGTPTPDALTADQLALLYETFA